MTAVVPAPKPLDEAERPKPPPLAGRVPDGAWRHRLVAMLFLAPTIGGIVIFTLIPIVASVVLAFFRWDVITPPRFVGLENFAEIATDPTVRVSFLNTIA